MDGMVQRLRSRSFSKTERKPEDDKLQGKSKRTDSHKEKLKVQLDDRMKASSKQANRSGRRPNVVQKRNSWFLRSQGSFSSEDGSNGRYSMSSDTEAVIAAATAFVVTAESAAISPTSSSRQSPQSTPQNRLSLASLPRIGEESTRRTDRSGDSRALVPSTSMRKERRSNPTEADDKDFKALVPASKIPPDSNARGKSRERVPAPTQSETDEKHLDRDDNRGNRRSGSGSSLATSRSRRDSFGHLAYEEGKREKRDAKAADWFLAKTTKIDDRYRQERGEILTWENEKKTKASMRLQAVERRLEEQRMNALKKLQNEIAEIERKADNRKAEVEAKRRAEQTKVAEMAKKIQRTGRMPNQCSCC